MKEITKDRPLDIAEALVEAYSSDGDLRFIVDDIWEYNHCQACSEIEETIKNFIKDNIVKYSNEHKRKMYFNNILLKAFNKEKEHESSIHIKYGDVVSFDNTLADWHDVSKQELETLETILEETKKDLLKNISIKEIVDINKEDIIIAIKTDKELKQYVENVVDYALDFDSIIKSEKEELNELRKISLNDENMSEDEKEDNESYISFTEDFIKFLENQNISKDDLVDIYSNALINKVLSNVLDDYFIDERLFNEDVNGKNEKEELISIIVKDLEKNPLNIDIDDVIDYYDELSKELSNKGIFIPDEDYMVHLIRKVFDNNYEMNIDGKEFDSYFDDGFDEFDRIDYEITDRTDYENAVLGSRHKQRVLRYFEDEKAD